MAYERTPEFNETTVLYQTDGTANKYGGVEDHINTIAGFGRAYGVEPHLLIGEGASPSEIADSLFTSFYPHEITTVKQRFPGRTPNSGVIDAISRYVNQANGAENYLAPWVSDDIRIRLRNLQPDIVHSMHPWQLQHGARVDKMLDRVSLSNGDLAHIGTYHIDSDERATNMAVSATGLWNRKRLDKFDAMIAVSDVALKHMNNTGYYSGDAQIIPNPVDVDKFWRATRFEDTEVKEKGVRVADQYIVFVGRPDNRKGLGELLGAFSSLNTQLPSMCDVELVICGDGPEKASYEQQAQDLGIKNVSFVGRVTPEDKARWLTTADLAVFPAKYGESQGIVLLEAMAAGSGVVLGGNNKGYAETFKGMSRADDVLFSPNNPNELVERMYRLLIYEQERQAIHAEQQAWVRDRYDIGVVGKQLLQVYRSVLDGTY